MSNEFLLLVFATSVFRNSCNVDSGVFTVHFATRIQTSSTHPQVTSHDLVSEAEEEMARP